jgi:general secretion pathway protein D
VIGSTKNKKLAALLIAAALTVSCANQKLYHDGNEAFYSGNYEQGLAMLEELVKTDPRNVEYRVQLIARREEAVNKLLAAGDRARSAGNLAQAEEEYKRALAVMPGNDRAQRFLDVVAADRRHNEMVEKAAAELSRGDLEHAESQTRAVFDEDPGFAPAIAMQAKIDAARGPISIVPRLKSHDNRPVTLQFRDANTKMVFEVLSRQTGINFVFDKEVKSDGKTTIFVQQVPVEEAIDLVLGQNQLSRQVLSDNMVMIYPNTSVKQKEYQDEIVKTFYLTNTDPKKAQELLKTVLNVKTLFVDDKANLLIMRDTPEAVRMAEKLVASLDLADAEVMMEVEVLEITRSSLQQLGIEYPTTATLSTPTNLTLESLHSLGKSDISVTPLSVTLDALKQVGRADTLASPRIRARSHEKAKILIGSREPVITNSVTPTASGAPVVTGTVQYLDVGLTLEVEPIVHLDNEVSIKMMLEVSSILKQITTSSGTVAYEIGARNAQTLLTLRDGETQILAGLIQDSDTRNSAHIPGLGDIPILGKLFGSDHIDKEKTEIVLSITPRIIRTTSRPSNTTTEFWYGTESNLRSAPLGAGSSYESGGGHDAPAAMPGGPAAMPGESSTMPGGPAAMPTGTSAIPVTPQVTGVALHSTYGSAVVAAAAQPTAAAAPPLAAAPTASAVPTAAATSATAATSTSAAAPAAAAVVLAAAALPAAMPDPPEAVRAKPQQEQSSDGPNLSWLGTAQTSVGQRFDVTLRLSTKQSLTRISSQLHFDGAVLQLDGVDTGSVIPSALPTPATPKINQHAGVVQYVVAASKDSPVHGDGPFLVLHFKALAASKSTPITLQFVATGTDGHNVRAGIPAAHSVSVGK